MSVSSTSGTTTSGGSSNASVDRNLAGFGRGKRKRVLPSRYDEDSYALLPTGSVKKSKNMSTNSSFNKESFSNGNSQDSISNQSSNKSVSGTSSKLERRLNLQKQLLQQVVMEDNLKRQQKQKIEESKKCDSPNTSSIIKMDENRKEILNNSSLSTPPLKVKLSLSNGKSTAKKPSMEMKMQSQSNSHQDEMKEVANSASHGRSILDSSKSFHQNVTNEEFEDDEEESSGVVANQPRQPCNSHCSGRPNIMPNLMCSRCFCLFHLECVPDGTFLQDPVRFICPVSLQVLTKLFLTNNVLSS